MDTKEFMDANGIEIFDTRDGYAYINEGYTIEDLEEEGFDTENITIPDETQFRIADLNRTKMGCAANNCGNTVMSRGKLCYYCKKKERGII